MHYRKRNYPCFLACFFASSLAMASAGRYSSEFAWNNPADIIIYETDMGVGPDLYRQKITLGSAAFNTFANFSGTSGLNFLPPVEGTASSHTTLWIGPSLNYILRATDKIAFGFSVGHPFETSIAFPKDSIVRFNGVEFTVTSWNIAPSLTYLILPNVAIGAGIDGQQIAATTSQMFPAPFLVDELFLENKQSGWGLGWHAGITSRLFKGTFLGLSYTSSVTQNITGPSTLVSNSTNIPLNQTTAITPITMPSYTALKLFQALSLKWGVFAEIDYTNWGTVQELLVENTALGFNISSPTNFHGVFRYVGGVRYAAAPWKVNAGFAYEQSPTNDINRTITGAEISYWAFGLSGEFNFNKNISVSGGYYYYPVGDVPLANTTKIATTQGIATVSSSEIEIKLKVYL